MWQLQRARPPTLINASRPRRAERAVAGPIWYDAEATTASCAPVSNTSDVFIDLATWFVKGFVSDAWERPTCHMPLCLAGRLTCRLRQRHCPAMRSSPLGKRPSISWLRHSVLGQRSPSYCHQPATARAETRRHPISPPTQSIACTDPLSGDIGPQPRSLAGTSTLPPARPLVSIGTRHPAGQRAHARNGQGRGQHGAARGSAVRTPG